MDDEITKLTVAIKNQFTDDNAELFLNKYWQKLRLETKISSTGFCYLASHSFYELALPIGKYKIKKITGKVGHFWIEDVETNNIIDLTSDQYIDGFKHYLNGKTATTRSSADIKKFIDLVKTYIGNN